ncbi:MAG TPA: peptide chain release factor N(5)-glutamine methyltransferase, partial [Acidimicrobiales bacterium]
TDTLTWRVALDDARHRLAAAGVDNAGQEARWLAEAAAGCAPGDLAAVLGGPVPAAAAARMAVLVERRVAGEPLQYVLGRWAFRRLELVVDPRVLIPRPETEVLAELALAEVDRLGARVAVDLGTGSGALALALATERPGLEVWGTDVSPDALAVAVANGAALPGGGAVTFVVGLWYEALPAELAGRVDVIVANPPYVSEAEMAGLPAEVRDWEPHGALCAGPDGLEDVAAIVRGATPWLASRGVVLVEMAPDQTARAAQLAREAGFGDVAIRDDLAGRARVLVVRP